MSSLAAKNSINSTTLCSSFLLFVGRGFPSNALGAGKASVATSLQLHVDSNGATKAACRPRGRCGGRATGQDLSNLDLPTICIDFIPIDKNAVAQPGIFRYCLLCIGQSGKQKEAAVVFCVYEYF
eukprot:scaffold5547_cov163-Amphora_coffeaeformis.AAC.6